jgi:hypothetical protein
LFTEALDAGAHLSVPIFWIVASGQCPTVADLQSGTTPRPAVR